MKKIRHLFEFLDFSLLPFDPTIFNADFKPPEAAFIEKSWGTNEHSFWLRITQHGRLNGYIHPPAALVVRNFEKCDVSLK